MISSRQTPVSRPHQNLAEFVDALQVSGRYTFRREEALAAVGTSEVAFKSAARRLAAKRRILAPRRGFFVIVPLEYRSAGAPPPSWFVSDLMAFHGRPYYVGLLSAAAIHGAAHQQPQEFQVVTDRPLRPTTAGRAGLRFLFKRAVKKTPTTRAKTETGSMRVSTPEATVFDLIRYADHAGFLSNVATVFSELAEVIDPPRLVEAARAAVELSVVQRGGFLLDHVGAGDVTEPLARWLREQNPRPTLLRPGRGRQDQRSTITTEGSRWRVVANEPLELDT